VTEVTGQKEIRMLGCGAQNDRPEASRLTIAGLGPLLRLGLVGGAGGSLSRVGNFGGVQAKGAANRGESLPAAASALPNVSAKTMSATADLSESPQKLQEPDPNEAELHIVRFLVSRSERNTVWQIDTVIQRLLALLIRCPQGVLRL
jgi:hypothetical protein